MFARYYVYIEHPYNEVHGALLTTHWAADLNGEGGDELLARIGKTLGQVPIYKHTRFRVGEPRADATRGQTVVPISLQPTGGPPLFRDMEGDLEVESFGALRTQLTLSVTYESPTGALADAIDRALLHRLADAAVEGFVQRLAGHIEQTISLPPREQAEFMP
jgi:hypothetical protein